MNTRQSQLERTIRESAEELRTIISSMEDADVSERFVKAVKAEARRLEAAVSNPMKAVPSSK